MALLDIEGRVTRVNAALATLLGRAEPDVLSAPFADLLDRESAERRESFGNLCLTGGDSINLRVTIPTPTGDSVAEATASVVRDTEHQPRYVSLNVLDITQKLAAQAERRARREAEVARATAEAHNRAKSEFLTSASHELRSPLQAITGFTELLGSLDLGDRRRKEALDRIDAAATHVLALVDDVLDIARLEANALPLRMADVVVSEVVEEVLALLAPLAARRHVVLCSCPSTDSGQATPRPTERAAPVSVCGWRVGWPRR